MRRAVVLFVTLIWGCSDDPILADQDFEVCLDRRDGERYCIDVYEASREDATMDDPGVDNDSAPRSLPNRRPWTQITWAGAREACASKGKRLCDFDEWIDACDGTVGEAGSTYTYGDTLDATICNTSGGGPISGGSRDGCQSTVGTYDQSGNVWEWTGGTMGAAAARGGAFPQSTNHRCADAIPGQSPNDTSPEIGFRCCR